jgi:hypothetical protein
MVWRDSADDGVDGGMIDVDGPGGASLDGLASIEDAADFLRGVLRLFREAVTAWCATDAASGAEAIPEELDSIVGWRHTIRRLRRTMVRAATLVSIRDQEPPPGMSPTEFDRLRWQRDAAAATPSVHSPRDSRWCATPMGAPSPRPLLLLLPAACISHLPMERCPPSCGPTRRTHER